MNIFDGLADMVFNATTSTMGYDATWIPNDESPSISARVHYNDKTATDRIGDIDYQPETPTMQYKYGDLPGLKEAIDRGNLETIVIDFRGQTLTFLTSSAKAIFDGRTIIVDLQATEP